jgi:hypothetical protein
MKKSMIGIIFGILVLMFLGYLLLNPFNQSGTIVAGKLIGQDIPHDTQILESYDTHAFHGDGEYYIVFQFTKNQYEKFLVQLLKQDKWEKTPIANDLKLYASYILPGEKKRSYQIPLYTKNGYYFYKDFQNTNEPIEKRYSHNFVIAVLDIKTYRLFVCRADS